MRCGGTALLFFQPWGDGCRGSDGLHFIVANRGLKVKRAESVRNGAGSRTVLRSKDCPLYKGQSLGLVAEEGAAMGGDGAGQGAEVVAALEDRDDAAGAETAGLGHDEGGELCVRLLDKLAMRQRIVAVRVESR